MVVITKRDTEISGSFTQLGKQVAKTLALIGRGRPRIRLQLIQYLKIKTARILNELRIGDVFCDLLCRWLIQRDIAARKSHESQFVLGQKIFELCWLEIRDSVGSELYAGKADRGNIVNRLTLFVAPRHGRVAEANTR